MAIPQFLSGKLRLCIGLGIFFAAGTANFGQLASEKLVTRTFNLNMPTLRAPAPSGVLEFSSSGRRPSNKEQMREFLLGAGVELTEASSPEGRESKKAYFYNERTGVLMVRAKVTEIDIIESALRALSMPPQVSLEMQFVESSRNDIDLNFTKIGTGPGTGILTEPQYRVAMKALKEAEGVNVITTPAITTISGRQARLSMERTSTPPVLTPPRLPKDMRPDADPTPHNKERLPFPPTFVPEGFSKDSPR
jgi:hypothetical protein